MAIPTQFTHVLAAINEELIKLDAPIIDAKGNFDGVDIGVTVSEDNAGGNSWYHKPSGKFRVQVGTSNLCYANDIRITGFPQLKRGGFSYPKIAAKIVEIAKTLEAKNEYRQGVEAEHKANIELSDRLSKELNVVGGVGLSSSHQTGQMTFTVYGIDREKAEKLVRVANELGLFYPKKSY